MARRGQDNIAAERQKVVRQRFRSLIRSVMYNRIWLADDDEQKKIVLNVRRNVAMLVRPRHKIGVLTMAEKGLIRCPHSLRSTEDRKTLLKLITNLECFRNFSPQIRARLIPVIKFVYLEAGRKIIKEGGLANTIYFILYGEVEASRRVFDSYKGSYVEKIEFIYSSGDCIGEIELIEGTLRTHNYTATSAVELLVVFEHDFDQILRAVMTKQWFQKKAALKAIGYFDHFSEEQFISATKLSALREFDALETIYHEDLGEASHAYFVLSGECMILQSLQLQVIENRYTRTYELLALNSTSAARTDIQNPNTHKGEALRKNSLMEEQNDSNTDYYSEINEINFALQSIRTKSIVEDIHRSLTEEINTHEDFSIESNVECEGSEEMGESMEALEVRINLQTSDDRTKVATSSPRNEESVNMLSENRRDQVQQSQAEKGESCSEEERKSVNSSSQKAALSVDTENINIETRFIDVGTLIFGGIFGLGEKIEDRVVMARTKVQCLLLPRYWLFEKDQNPGRIWQRRKFVINTSIPSRWQLYKDFLNTRKWQKYKNILISNILDADSVQNPTHFQDIPIMFHIINPVEE